MVDQTRPYSHSEPLAKAIELLLIKLPGPETTAKRPPTPLPDRVRRLLASDVDEIRDGYRAGATVTRLAQQFDIDRETVRRILNQAAIPRRPRGLSDEQIDEAVLLYSEGMSLARLGHRYGVDAQPRSADAVGRVGWRMLLRQARMGLLRFRSAA